MSSKDDNGPKEFGGSDSPATSWVRMPSRESRSAPAPQAPEPAPTWSPPSTRAPSEAPRGTDAANPFGGFQAGQATGAMRRSVSSSRFWAVFGVVVVVIGLSAAAIAIALMPGPAPKEKPLPETPEVKPPEPKPEPEEPEGDAEAEALGYTKAGEKTTTSSAKTTKTTKSTGTKSTGTKSTGTKTTTSPTRTGNPGKTRPQGH